MWPLSLDTHLGLMTSAQPGSVRTFDEGFFAFEIKRSQIFFHSGFSTHRSGNPALAVSLASPASQSAWSAEVQTTSAGQWKAGLREGDAVDVKGPKELETER